MSSEKEALARAAYRAISEEDLDAFLALIHPDVEFQSLIAEAEGGVYRGHDGVREWWAEVKEALGGLEFELSCFHDLGGDDGYNEIVVSGTVSGVPIEQRMYQATRVRDGKAIWWRVCRTEAEAREALGVA